MSEQEFIPEEEVTGTRREMNEIERDLAERMYSAINDFSNRSERSQQAAGFQFGLSDLGFCSERSRRMLDQQVPEETDALLAFIGTALGDHMEQAWLAKYPDAIRQAEVELVLQGESRTYTLPGHPDLIIPAENLLVDNKSTFGLNIVRRTGASRSQQFQRHCYAKAAHEAGYFDCALEDVQVANIWIDRSGHERSLHVQMEPYDETLVAEAGFWLDDVVYAYTHEEEARKEPPREMCAVTCGFFRVCRAYDTDVEGLLTDPAVLAAVELVVEGRAMKRDGGKMEKEGKAVLSGISGSTGAHTVRWTEVGESQVDSFTKRAYKKLDIKPIK